MPTDKQRAASRANSQKSTGPRTAEGQAASRFNALKHGIFAQTQIIFDETAEALDELAAEYHGRYSPTDAAERFLVDTLVDNEWRLRRLRRIEGDIWRLRGGRILDNRRRNAEDQSKVIVPTAGEVFYVEADKFLLHLRAVNSCERNYHRALKELNRIQARREPSANSEPEESKPASTSSASFRNNSQSATQDAPQDGFDAPLQAAPVVAPVYVPPFPADPRPDLPEAA